MPTPDQRPGQRLSQQRQDAVNDGGMERWQESLSLSLGHEVIAQFVGEWTYDAKLWFDQDAPPERVSWECSAEPTMGGLFVELRSKGEVMGDVFEELAVLGYDNNRKLFHLTSFSTMDTGVMPMWGNIDDEGKTLTFVGAMSDAMTGESGKAFMVTWTIDSRDQWTQRVSEIVYGEPFVVFESTATRRGG